MRFAHYLVALALAAAVTACGIKGPLYLPPPQPAAAPPPPATATTPALPAPSDAKKNAPPGGPQ